MEIFNMEIIFIGIIGIALILGWSYYCATRIKGDNLSADEKIMYNKQHLVVGSTWWTLIIRNLPVGHAIENNVTDKVCKIKEIKDNKVLVESYGPINSYEEEIDINTFVKEWEFIK